MLIIAAPVASIASSAAAAVVFASLGCLAVAPLTALFVRLREVVWAVVAGGSAATNASVVAPPTAPPGVDKDGEDGEVDKSGAAAAAVTTDDCAIAVDRSCISALIRARSSIDVLRGTTRG